MPAGHPFSSSKKVGAGLAALILLVMAGCSATGSQMTLIDTPAPQSAGVPELRPSALEDALNVKPTLQASDDDVKYAVNGSAAKLKPTVAPADTSDLRLTHVEPASDTATPPVGDTAESAWCTNMRERALADSSILRGPRVGGSFDDLGKAEVTIGVHYSDFRKATLVEQHAEAECRKFMAERGLQKLVARSPQNLTSAGFRAKADAIDAERIELERLRQNVISSMNAGNINREKASSMLMLIEQLQADGLSARSQVDRRVDDHAGFAKSARALGTQLLEAERELDAIDSAAREADNVDVEVQANYNQYVNGVPEGTAPSTQGFGGKVSFSMKLGVLNPQLHEHERLATEAKDRAIRTEDGGPIWQAEEMRRNQQRAISALEESQGRIENAMAEARKLLSELSEVSQPEFEAAKFNARYQILKMRADKAAITGSLAEIRANLKHLDNG